MDSKVLISKGRYFQLYKAFIISGINSAIKKKLFELC